jgi:hypothetical protein
LSFVIPGFNPAWMCLENVAMYEREKFTLVEYLVDTKQGNSNLFMSLDYLRDIKEASFFSPMVKALQTIIKKNFVVGYKKEKSKYSFIDDARNAIEIIV